MNSINADRSVRGWYKDGGVWMKSVSKTAFVGALYLAITVPQLLAAEPNQAAHPHEGHHHLNVVELFVGNTQEDAHHGSENGFTVRLTYERRLSSLWGVGGSYEYAAGDFDKWSIAVPLFIHPYKGWRFELAPGLEHKKNEDEFLLRIGAAYEFMLSNRWMLIPEIAVDVVDGEEAIVYGLALGFGF
jgi:hypothetical protein